MTKHLKWPIESSRSDLNEVFRWQQPGSNQCLDLHGNPTKAKLVVYSDGNHHMALEACCQLFRQEHPDVEEIFYATTPPRVILQSVLQGGLLLGNLQLNVQPHVFISPDNILEQLVTKSKISSHQAFARSSGNALLFKKGNPKKIKGINDLLRDDVRLTISNPVTEKASYDVYATTLLNVAKEQGLDVNAYSNLINKDSTRAVFGESIHHREVPQTIFEGRADVAVVYYHLALRYSRIFPDYFDFIKIESEANVCTDYHIGLMNDAGEWGQQFLDFMLSDDALTIYKEHGLQAT
jgi:accessory colonization factor AcfC